MTDAVPLPKPPVTDDPDTGPFFDHVQRRTLGIQVCTGCQRAVHLPQRYCYHCGTWSNEWVEVSGRGRIYTWTAIHHQMDPAFPPPFTIIVVELADRPEVRLIGNLPGCPELAVGQAVVVRYEEMTDGVLIPQWSLE